MKRCKTCGEEKSATSDFWNRNTGFKDGWLNHCKECKNKKARKRFHSPEFHDKMLAKQHERYYHPDVHEKSLAQMREYGRAHKEERDAKARQYYQKNDEQVRARVRDYRQNNRDKINAYKRSPEYQEYRRSYDRRRARRPYHTSPEMCERRRTWLREYRSRPGMRERRNEQEKIYRSRPENRVYHQSYYRNHGKAYWSRPDVREQRRVYDHNRRIRKRAIAGSHTAIQIQEQLKRQNYRCYYAACDFAKFKKDKAKSFGYNFHIEHTFPLSRVAGTDIPANDMSYLVLACPACNMQKHNKFPHEFFEGGRLL